MEDATIMNILKMDKLFVDRFDKNSYTISRINDDECETDIAVVHNYHHENPLISFRGTRSLEELEELIKMIKEQQKDIDCFGSMITELNANGKD